MPIFSTFIKLVIGITVVNTAHKIFKLKNAYTFFAYFFFFFNYAILHAI